jgi:hypothetical protein
VSSGGVAFDDEDGDAHVDQSRREALTLLFTIVLQHAARYLRVLEGLGPRSMTGCDSV